jgi:hypothetical protein
MSFVSLADAPTRRRQAFLDAAPLGLYVEHLGSAPKPKGDFPYTCWATCGSGHGRSTRSRAPGHFQSGHTRAHMALRRSDPPNDWVCRATQAALLAATCAAGARRLIDSCVAAT